MKFRTNMEIPIEVFAWYCSLVPINPRWVTRFGLQPASGLLMIHSYHHPPHGQCHGCVCVTSNSCGRSMNLSCLASCYYRILFCRYPTLQVTRLRDHTNLMVFEKNKTAQYLQYWNLNLWQIMNRNHCLNLSHLELLSKYGLKQTCS